MGGGIECLLVHGEEFTWEIAITLDISRSSPKRLGHFTVANGQIIRSADMAIFGTCFTKGWDIL
jgi:hypothetical protein